MVARENETGANRLMVHLNAGAQMDQDQLNAARARLQRRVEIMNNSGDFSYQGFLAAERQREAESQGAQ